MNIVFFGDSLTRGTFGVSFVDKVASALPNHHFINKGVNGDTTLNLYRRVTRDVVDLKPDGVFIMVGNNDAISHAEPGTRLYYRFAKQIPRGQVSPISARENMRAILSRLTTARIKTWVGLPPVEYNPETVEALRKLNGYTAEVCAEMHVPALNLMAKLTPARVPPRPHISLAIYPRNFMIFLSGKSAHSRLHDAGNFTYTFDGFHLTEDGAQRFADLIVPFLRANGAA
jgi:lysophospholipase L1-like esterase